MVEILPFVIDGTTVPGEEIRRALKTKYQSAGVVNSTDLAVSANGTPNMSVNVALGEAIVFGTEQTEQGAYHVYNDATVNKAIATSDLTNPRIDLVMARVRDAEYSGAVRAWDIYVKTGTPAASPSAPALEANSLSLATVLVGAGVSTITGAAITDTRVRVSSKPWNLPWGYLDYKTATANQAGIGSSLTDITSLTSTLTYVANRRIRITTGYVIQDLTTAGLFVGDLRNDATTIQGIQTGNLAVGELRSVYYSAIITPTAGSHTLKARGSITAGTVTIIASATAPAFLSIEDIGPATVV